MSQRNKRKIIAAGAVGFSILVGASPALASAGPFTATTESIDATVNLGTTTDPRDNKGALAIPRNHVSGAVSSVSGNFLTVRANDGTSYTVNAVDARIGAGRGRPVTISTIKSGDQVFISGSQVTELNLIKAAAIIDLTQAQAN